MTPKASLIFLDIETIPSQAPDALERATARVKVPGNYSKPETIAAYIASNAEAEWRKTSLDGTHGELLAIGVAFGDASPAVLTRGGMGDPNERHDGSERELLERFWALVSANAYASAKWVGHNIVRFDLKFLYHRSAVNDVLPPFPLPISAGPWSDDVADTSYMWTRERNQGVKLEELAAALGIECADNGLDGSMIWDAVKAGRLDDIAAYCLEDVRLTRAIYQRLTPFGA